jgi:hypothetical protein
VAAPLPVAGQQALARRCLLTALPYSSGTRRRVLIVGLLGLERAAGGATRGYSPADVSLDAEFALIGSDTEVREAIERLELLPVGLAQHYTHGLATAIEMAIATIADEAPDGDELLYQLLVSCLDDHRGGRARTGVAARNHGDGVGAGREFAD